MTKDGGAAGNVAQGGSKTMARVILGCLVATSLVIMGVPDFPTISLGQTVGPQIELLNPSSFAETGTARAIIVSDQTQDYGPGCPSPGTTEGRCEPTPTYRLSAWTVNAPVGSSVFFLITQGAQEFEVTATAVTSDTWEAEWDIPATLLEGIPGRVQAFLVQNNLPLDSDAEDVTFSRTIATSRHMYPESGGRFGTFAPLRTALPAVAPGTRQNPRSVVDAIFFITDTSSYQRTFYTVSAPGTEPEWEVCATEPVASGANANNGMRCILTDPAHETKITAIASVTNDSPDEYDERFNNSGDVVRPTQIYLQEPTTLTVTANRQQQVNFLGNCSVATVVELDDQFERHIVGANVDVHAVGPTDRLKFNNVATPLLSGQGQRPDRGPHAADEPAFDCNGQATVTPPDSPPQNRPPENANPSRQGEHQAFGTPDPKHLEVGGGGTGDDTGAYSFRLRSPDAGGARFTAWVDEIDDGCATNDDVFTHGEVFADGSVGWTSDPPEPQPIEPVALTPCTLPTTTASPSGTASPTDTASPSESESPQPSKARQISISSNKSSIKRRGRFVLSGDIHADEAATCEPNQRVKIKARRPGRSFRTIRVITTDGTGDYSVDVRSKFTKEYRAVATRTESCNKALSRIVKVRVRNQS